MWGQVSGTEPDASSSPDPSGSMLLGTRSHRPGGEREQEGPDPSQLPLQGVRELLLVHLLPLLLDPGVGDRVAPGETEQSAPDGGQTPETQPPGLCPVPGLGSWGGACLVPDAPPGFPR